MDLRLNATVGGDYTGRGGECKQLFGAKGIHACVAVMRRIAHLAKCAILLECAAHNEKAAAHVAPRVPGP